MRHRELLRLFLSRSHRVTARRSSVPSPTRHPIQMLHDRLGNAGMAQLARARADRERDERDADRAADAFVQPPSQHAGSRVDDVRIHTSGPAADTAQALGAQAYTVGRDIAFAPGRFAPETTEGRRLIGHELAHVEQQRGGERRLQRKGEEKIPPYLVALHLRIRAVADRRVQFWAEETGPIGDLRRKYPVSPLNPDAVFDIPAIDWEHPFNAEDFTFDDEGKLVPAHPNRQTQFKLHSALAGEYELVDILGDGRILIERGGVGYVFNDKVFSFLFGEELPELFHDMEEPSVTIHEHPEYVLAMDFGMQFIPAVTAMLFGMPEAEVMVGGAPLVGWESESVAAFDINAMPTFLSEDLTSGANVFEVLGPGVTPPLFAPYSPYSFATSEAWVFDGRVIRVVNTPAGPRAFYQHTGWGGDFPTGAQIGDWVPFEGFEGGHFVKPESAFAPSTPLTLLRWGTEENEAIGMWIKAQPEVPAVDVGDAWGIIQQRLQQLGVPVAHPL